MRVRYTGPKDKYPVRLPVGNKTRKAQIILATPYAEVPDEVADALVAFDEKLVLDPIEKCGTEIELGSGVKLVAEMPTMSTKKWAKAKKKAKKKRKKRAKKAVDG